MRRLHADSVALCRDRRGRVQELIVLNHGAFNRVGRSFDVAQLQLREATLRNVSLKYEGVPVKYEHGIELWAVGARGDRFALKIPSVDQFILSGDCAQAATFMNVLVDSEEQLGAWLTQLLEKEAKAMNSAGREEGHDSAR